MSLFFIKANDNVCCGSYMGELFVLGDLVGNVVFFLDRPTALCDMANIGR